MAEDGYRFSGGGAAASGTSVSLADKGGWATTTAYVVGDVVTQAGQRYIARTAHTAGTFATDLTAAKWVVLDAVAAPAAGLLSARPTATGSKSTYIATDLAGGTLFVDTAASVWTAGGQVSPAYDKRTNGYNVTAAGLRKFRAALAKAEAGTGLCDIVMLGTSISAGSGSTRTTSWPEYVRQYLIASGYPNGGTGVMVAAGLPADPRVTLGSGWSAFSSPASPLAQCSTGGATITFAADSAGTVVDVYTFEGGGPTPIAWTIDGVAQTPITVGSSTAVKKTTVSGLSNATHTVVITASSTGITYVLGVDVHQTTGVKVTNLGMGGAQTGNLVNAQSFSPGTFARTFLSTGLMFVEYGANNAIGTVTADGATLSGGTATGYSELVTGITAIQALAGADCVLVSTGARSGQAWPTAAATASDYSNSLVLRYLSDLYGVPLVDMNDRLAAYTTWNTALGLGASDGIHPNAAGAREYARAVYGIFRA